MCQNQELITSYPKSFPFFAHVLRGFPNSLRLFTTQDLLLHHGDLVLMDRRIAGTKPNGLQRPSRWRVTHRAGGLRARHCPRRLRSEDARSFVTLVPWRMRLSGRR